MHSDFRGANVRLFFGMAFFGLAPHVFAQQAPHRVSSPAPLPTTAAAAVLPDAPSPQIELVAAADPQSDMRGSAEYKRQLIVALAKRAIQIAARRARGEKVEGAHLYA